MVRIPQDVGNEGKQLYKAISDAHLLGVDGIGCQSGIGGSHLLVPGA